MKRGFLDLLDPSNDPEFFWQVISGPPCIDLSDKSSWMFCVRQVFDVFLVFHTILIVVENLCF
jgi:hypothetical protein